MFRGLQKPLEFMGLQGRYIYWAAAAVGGGILGFIIGYIVSGFLAGIVTLACMVCGLGGPILLKQKKGLHSKREDRGVLIYCRDRSL